MSKSHDDRITIKLSPENEEALVKAHKRMTVPISFTAFVNWFIKEALEVQQRKWEDAR